jgi:hypothetical protein
MAFLLLNATPSAAVATNGTIAFTLSDASQWGQVSQQTGHKMYSRGLQALLSFDAGDFTLSASGATVTATYKGTTSIPANTLVELQLDAPGPDNWISPETFTQNIKDAYGNVRATMPSVIRVSFGAPAAASATKVVNASARAGTVTTTYATPVVLDVPRTLAVKSSTTDTTQTVTVKGTDEYGVAITEHFALNGTTAIVGNKAFKTVISDANDIALAGNLSIGTNAGGFGLPFFLPGGTTAAIGYVLKEAMDGTTPTAGTAIGGDLTVATATTKDVRGVYTPNTAPNAAHIFEVFVAVSDPAHKGVAQYGGA